MQATVSLLFLLLENICWIGTMYTLKLLIDRLVNRPAVNNAAGITSAILLAGCVAILYGCVKSISAFLNEKQSAAVNNYIDKQIHQHTISLDYGCYEDPAYFDVLKRAREGGIDRPYAVVLSLHEIGKNITMLGSMGYILISIDWILLPLLCLFVAPLLVVRLNFSEKLYLWQRKHTGMDREASYLSTLITGDSSAKEIRSFSLGQHLLNKYCGIKGTLLEHQVEHSRQRTIVELISTVVTTVAFFAVTAYIIFGIMNGKTSVGDIAVFLVVFPQSFSVMQGLAGGISRLYQNNRYLSDVFALFDLKPVIESSVFTGFKEGKESNDFVVENLYFKYPHASDYVLENIHLSIPAGQIIGLVGLNGAGKSTLIKLLCRLYDPVEGMIRIGDKDIRELNINEYRSKISVVFQDFVKYNLTANENIRLGNIHAPTNTAEIKKAAEDAGAANYINNFPDQYDTILGRIFENGHEISVGQWQKLAIARAFYGKSQLIILDEATSSLDAIAEHELFVNIKQKLGGRSALVISHRLSTIQQADLIYVMGDKKIIEYGTHEILLQNNGTYAALYKS
ncbi:ABC transporter ATP-binding protein [Chitinophaga niastensis]|nr:ABC transporter ATP-binding protein [Chitinophaga niastensis]